MNTKWAENTMLKSCVEKLCSDAIHPNAMKLKEVRDANVYVCNENIYVSPKRDENVYNPFNGVSY